MPSGHHPVVYWTDADDAELSVLVYEFVHGVYEHRNGCGICKHGGRWCQPLVEALEIIMDWRQGRILVNKAIALRALQQHQEMMAFAS